MGSVEWTRESGGDATGDGSRSQGKTNYDPLSLTRSYHQITNDAGHTAVYEAQSFGKDEVVEILLRVTDFEEVDDDMEESDIEETLDVAQEEEMR